MKVEPFDRNSFLVQSGPNAYVVDLEERFCSCDCFSDDRQQPEPERRQCKHFDAVNAFVAKQNKTQPKHRKAALVIL